MVLIGLAEFMSVLGLSYLLSFFKPDFLLEAYAEGEVILAEWMEKAFAGKKVS